MRIAGITCVFLSLFLLSAAVLTRTYVYRELAVVPGDAGITATISSVDGEPATYFDPATLRVVSAPLTTVAVVRGDSNAGAAASERLGRDVVVWDTYTCTGPATETCTTEVLPLAGERSRLALDAYTAEALDWEGTYRETGGAREDRPRLTGYVLKLPFGVDKRTYPWWNPDLRAAADLRYTGRATVQGLDVYRFVQTIPPTKTGSIELPGQLVGSVEPTVTGARMASSTLELTVEPESGIIVTRRVSLDNYVNFDGRRVLTLIRGTFEADEETVRRTVEDNGPISTKLYTARLLVPIGAGFLGVPILVVGVVLATRSHRHGRRPGALD